MAKQSDLYDEDFVRWTEDQAAALRRARGANLPLDWDNLAEEIESLGKSDRRELGSQLRRVMRHLLKLMVSPAGEPRRGWHATVREGRAEIAKLLRASPSLRREVDEMIAEEAALAAELAAADLDRHGELDAAIEAQLARLRLTSEQVLDPAWFPLMPDGNAEPRR